MGGVERGEHNLTLKSVERMAERLGVEARQGVGKVGSGAWLGDELDGSFWAS